jgi:YggT family protein
MLILGRIYWLLNWAVIFAIVAVIGLMVLRLLANYADLNPFSWASLTIKRLTDPMVGPVRRSLVRLAVDGKYAPLVTILIAILLGWFVLQLLDSLANTVAGVMLASQQGALIAVIGYLLYGLLALYALFIFVRIVFSWGMVSYGNRVMRFVVNVTEPLLGPLRRMIPPLGMFDISPIVAFFVLLLFQQAVAGTLLRGFRVEFF